MAKHTFIIFPVRLRQYLIYWQNFWEQLAKATPQTVALRHKLAASLSFPPAHPHFFATSKSQTQENSTPRKGVAR
jgi:hypothetical protein